jgi:hypothetical protein
VCWFEYAHVFHFESTSALLAARRFFVKLHVGPPVHQPLFDGEQDPLTIFAPPLLAIGLWSYAGFIGLERRIY